MSFGRHLGYFLLDSFQSLFVNICLSSLFTGIEDPKTISLLHESIFHVRVKLVIILYIVRLSIWLRILNHLLQILHLLQSLRIGLIEPRCLILFALFSKPLHEHLIIGLVASLDLFCCRCSRS